jgi:hypothetical protein
MLEGNTNESWWDWKDTLGPLRNRTGREIISECLVIDTDFSKGSKVSGAINRPTVSD